MSKKRKERKKVRRNHYNRFHVKINHVFFSPPFESKGWRGCARVVTAYIPGNTDCAEIEVLLLFCDADPTVIVPIGECGDKLGRAAAGGL